MSDFDVIICGGGLAGLTLARQLRLELPRASVAVVEPTRRPLPTACHKVGESSVEMGTHYLARVVGLEDYLDAEHLQKNGLRFFSGPKGTPLWERTELGPSDPPIVPSYQMDRGKLENDLRAMVVDEGVTLFEGWVVRDVELAPDSEHRVAIFEKGDAGSERTLSARWVIDASGRRQLLQRKLGLRRPSGNEQSASWFRIARQLKVRDLVPPEHTRWHQRDIDDNRWLSTVHLTGLGYWVWLIPLSTGHTSIGIVASAEEHPFDTFDDEPKARAWLAAHEPELAAWIAEVPFEDFKKLKHYSYSSAQCFSTDRWACVGEAGLFVDPLYSPGSDFIGLANCFAAELVREDLDSGGNDPTRVQMFNDLHIGWAREINRVLDRNARIFPEHDVFGAKLWWDFFVYWTFMCPYFFRQAYRLDAASLAPFHQIGERYNQLNLWAQALCEVWAELKTNTLHPGRPFIPLPMFPSILADQHLELLEDRTLDQTLERMREDVRKTEELLQELLLLALRGVGPKRAAELGRRIDLGRWDLPIDVHRLHDDAQPRRERRERMSSLVRDLERALGRFGEGPPLQELVQLAGINLESPSACDDSASNSGAPRLV